MNKRAGRITIAVAGLACTFLAGCDACGKISSVTGKNTEDPTWLGSQSETAATSALYREKTSFVIAYNDDTQDGKVVYTATDRVLFPGASLLGWSYSLDRGATWTYGGKVKPPAGIGALWGDPAIVTSRTNYGRVYISSLAVADSKIPVTGHHGALTDNSITGACVARSDDGGIHFAIHSCFSSGGDFYDGGAMAAGNGGDPRVFAAYVDVPRNQIHVWASPDGLAPFVRITDPFPGMGMHSHPRMAYDPSTGALLVAAIATNGLIYFNRLVGSTWQTPIQASKPTTRIDIKVGSQTIRMAYGFSFDVGAPSVTDLAGGEVRINDDAIRLLYTTRDAATHRIYVRGSACRYDLAVCNDVPGWGTTPGNLNTPRDQWNPTVAAFPGFFGMPPVWKATYQTTDDDPAKVSIKQGTLAVAPNGTPFYWPFNMVPPRIICPDFRNGSSGAAISGYWGDYDEISMVGFSSGSTIPEFLLPFSDSSKGCVSQSKFTSNHLHVGSVVFQ